MDSENDIDSTYELDEMAIGSDKQIDESELPIDDMNPTAAQQVDTSDREYEIQYIVKNEDRVCSDIMSKLEFTSLVGQRSKQIEKTGAYFALLPAVLNQDINSADISIIELLQGKCPLMIKKVISNKYVELYDTNKMILPKISLGNLQMIAIQGLEQSAQNHNI